MNTTEYRKHLRSINACSEAVEWSKPYGAQEAWDKCERGDWMLWLAGRLSGDSESDSRRALVLCACECARLALKHVPDGEDRPLKAIETAERWANGDSGVTLDDVRAANAANAANAYAAAAAYDAAYAAARKKALSETAEIVRKHYPTNPVIVSNPKEQAATA